jgi:DNA-binding Lrp family transcriptional regulator
MPDLTVVVCVAFDHRASAERLARFKECICHCPLVDSALEVAGTFDLIVQGRCSSLAEYNENMDRIRGQLAEFVTRIETNFVGKKIERNAGLEDVGAVWLPCEGGRKRVEAHLIDKIVAEGDYMRVHVGGWNCLVHHTMQRLSEQLGSSNFIKLNRSVLVRIGFIDRLVHDEHRWKARLCDGTQVGIAKSHIKAMLRMMTGESTSTGREANIGARALTTNLELSPAIPSKSQTSVESSR